MMRMVVLVAVLGSSLVSIHAQDRQPRRERAYPPTLAGAKVAVYKTVGDVKLNLYIFRPHGHRPSDERPAIVFFFGGGWNNGTPRQFEPHCRYLASRGMVAMTADYRVGSRHGVTPVACVQDAKSAIRWVRQNAKRLGVDPKRIAAGGGSAGGHIAACAGVVEALDEPNEKKLISSRPDAMVLFNPVMALAPATEAPTESQRQRYERFKDRVGRDPRVISPAHHVRRGLPPSIIFFGTDDWLLEGARWFAEKATQAHNRCELINFEGKRHGFFNYGRKDNKSFVETLRLADRFLASLGYLAGEPTIDKWIHR